MEHVQRPCPLKVGIRAAQPVLGSLLPPDQPGLGQDMLQINQQGRRGDTRPFLPFHPPGRLGGADTDELRQLRTRIRTRLAAKGSSAAVDRAPARSAAVTFVVVVFVWVLVIEP